MKKVPNDDLIWYEFEYRLVSIFGQLIHYQLFRDKNSNSLIADMTEGALHEYRF